MDCRVNPNCPKGYTQETLRQLAKQCHVDLKRSEASVSTAMASQSKGKKTMKEICAELKEKHGELEVATSNECNETFGMTVEFMMCRIANIPTTIKETRIAQRLVNDEFLNTLLRTLMAKIPQIQEHIGHENKAADFYLVNGKSLSVKTNQSNGKSVCPQNIGQTTRKKFYEHFTSKIPMITRSKTSKQDIQVSDIKSLVLSFPAHLMMEYFKNTFICDYMLWIFKKKGAYTGIVLDKNDIFKKMLNHKNYTFTRDADTWKESTTIKYNGVGIGEFQVHTKRDGVKFRFHMEKLLEILAKDGTVIVVPDVMTIRSVRPYSSKIKAVRNGTKKIKSY